MKFLQRKIINMNDATINLARLIEIETPFPDKSCHLLRFKKCVWTKHEREDYIYKRELLEDGSFEESNIYKGSF